MSFPSALVRLSAGDQPAQALLHAMRTDTRLGYTAIMAVAAAAKDPNTCPCCTVKTALPEDHRASVLRHERRGDGVIIDFDPDSTLGKQIARLLGTDAARPIMTGETGLHLGFANCCKVLASARADDVRFSAEDQIKWQSSIDC